LFCDLRKAKPAIWDGDRNPPGLELLNTGAERGNYAEAKLKRKGWKADFRAMTRALEVHVRVASADPRSTELRRRWAGAIRWKAGNTIKMRSATGASSATGRDCAWVKKFALEGGTTGRDPFSYFSYRCGARCYTGESRHPTDSAILFKKGRELLHICCLPGFARMTQSLTGQSRSANCNSAPPVR
jgi:hypothetical protein